MTDVVNEIFEKSLGDSVLNEKRMLALKYQAEVLEAIVRWSEGTPDGKEFNLSFVSSLLEQVESGKELSDKQNDSLNRIISGFKINIGKWVS